MASRVWLFGLLLAIPLIGIVVTEAIQSQWDSKLQSAIRTKIPEAQKELIAEVSFDHLCEDPVPELEEHCSAYGHISLLENAAIGAGLLGFGMLFLIRLAGTLGKENRDLLARLFKPGLYVTVCVLIGLIATHAAVAMGALYYAESSLFGRIHTRSIAAIGLGACIGIWVMARSAFSAVEKVKVFVAGKKLSRREAPELWKCIEETANRLGALVPDNLVVGLEPNFFVTEATVTCLSGTLEGRTLYCSLPLCRILSKEELVAIIGHELGHFKGEDTKFSQRFYPVYRGTLNSLSALASAEVGWFGRVSMLPAMAVLSYFLECFSIAERRLSRLREFAADQAAASVSSARTIAAALVKLHAFIRWWGQLLEAAASSLHEGRIFVNMSRVFAEAVTANARPESIEGVAGAELTHPTDSHPPLSERLESLQVKLDDVAADALAVAPQDAAISLVTEVERREEEISEAYQAVLAQQLGIELS